MLQLLLERGQSYDDIAAVLGEERGDVRGRAHAALGELAGSDPDPALADYLLGQADPVGRADAARRLRDEPAALELASRAVAELREVAPGAELPSLPAGRAQASSPRTAPAPEPPGAGLSRRQRLVLLALAAGAIAVVAVVAVVAGAFDGDDEPVGAPQPGAAGAAEEAVQVKLEPQGASEAGGEAIFGLATADQLFLDLRVNGLEPPSPDQTYVIWMLLSPEEGYPVSPIGVSEDGTFADRFPIPRFAVQIASQSRYLDVSLVDRDELSRQVADFAKDLEQGGEVELPVLPYEGESALRGELPASGDRRLLEESAEGDEPAPSP